MEVFDFRIIRRLAQGGINGCYEVEDQDGRHFSMKVIHYGDESRLVPDLEIGYKLDHPNCLGIEVAWVARKYDWDHQKWKIVYIVSELFPMDLFTYLKENGGVAIPLIPGIMYQLLTALEYLHSQNIFHAGVYAENCLWDPKTNRLKLCDYKYSREIDGPVSMTIGPTKYHHRSPEWVWGSSHVGFPTDVWGAGIVLADMWYGRRLMDVKDSEEVVKSAIREILGHPSSEDLGEFRTGKRPQSREEKPPPKLKFPQRFEDRLREFDASGQCRDLLAKMLVFSPSRRATVAECMAHPYFDAVREK
jgi:serine/threonine protein kinase